MTREPYTYAQCESFCGSGMTCKRGIAPGDVTDEEGRLPCVSIRGITGKVVCDQRVMPAEPPRGAKGPASKMLDALLEGRCPKCGESINGEMEFNDSILAMPCRHVIRSPRE